MTMFEILMYMVLGFAIGWTIRETVSPQTRGGYQPRKSNLDFTHPPQGGSGVSSVAQRLNCYFKNKPIIQKGCYNYIEPPVGSRNPFIHDGE